MWRSRLRESPIEELIGAHAVVWTTTPWTIPVNQALAYGPDLEYVLLETTFGMKLLVASELQGLFGERGRNAQKVGGYLDERLSDGNDQELLTVKGSDLAGTVARHPMHNLGGFYATPRPFLAGDFVTTDSGTGLVHMAPDHGEDDFLLCKEHGIEPQFAVMNDGRYRDDWLWLGGNDERRRSVINKPFNSPEGPICSDLREAGALLSASADYAHSYPHSWRSKAKVIFRCTPQWFVPMDKPLTNLSAKTPSDKAWENEGGAVDPTEETLCASPTLRENAMQAIAGTRFVPEKGRNRLGSMVEGRPDWVLSRQRAWGVPITLFVRPDGSYLQDPAVNARVVEAVRDEGMDAWSEANKATFLGPDHNPDEFEMVTDILDVWFDSGTTHAWVLEGDRWPELQWPADLYLEGSDQHRGWFQSSLLESCATRGRAPFNEILTHGFTMASDGRKMSKSLGNTIDPLKVMEQYGADIIRLWALSVDFTEDHRIGDEILKGVGDQYRRLRNTFRYLLGALDGFVGDMGDTGEIPELEVYVLALLADLDGKLKQGSRSLRLQHLHAPAQSISVNEDLSAFYLRYPQGQSSIATGRTAFETQCLSHRARPAVPCAGALCRAGAGIYGGRSAWTDALSRGWRAGRQCTPARLAERAHGCHRRRDTLNGTSCGHLRERGDRGNRAAAPRQDHPFQPRGGRHGSVPECMVPEGFTDDDNWPSCSSPRQ